MSLKKDGTREQFSRDKIFNGIIRSAQNVLFLVMRLRRLLAELSKKCSNNENEIVSEFYRRSGNERISGIRMRLPMFALPVSIVVLKM